MVLGDDVALCVRKMISFRRSIQLFILASWRSQRDGLVRDQEDQLRTWTCGSAVSTCSQVWHWCGSRLQQVVRWFWRLLPRPACCQATAVFRSSRWWMLFLGSCWGGSVSGGGGYIGGGCCGGAGCIQSQGVVVLNNVVRQVCFCRADRMRHTGFPQSKHRDTFLLNKTLIEKCTNCHVMWRTHFLLTTISK